ncbi:MAG: DUF1841 family protein [Gammaproteobacteria bacterium]|nr:DUF1841 family protein [Gammaproteobacteria bacterium]
MLVDSRDDSRRFLVEVWRRFRQGAVLEPLPALIADVLRAHPEYHGLLEDPGVLTRDFAPDEPGANPFLHLGLHIALQEQIQTNRPAGITPAYQQLCALLGDRHAVEHQLMSCLWHSLHEAQGTGRPPDENAFLQRVRNLLP